MVKEISKQQTLLAVLDEVNATPIAKVSEREGNIRLVCFLAAQGEGVETIARKMDLPETFVDACVHSAQGADMIVRFQNALYTDVPTRINKTANLALDRKIKLMLTSTNDAVVNSATSDLLDRSLGKAIQVTENRNMNFDMNDPRALDKAIQAQLTKLQKLEDIEARVKAAVPVKEQSD